MKCEGKYGVFKRRRDEQKMSVPKRTILVFCCMQPWELAQQMLGSLWATRLGSSSVQK